MRASVIIAAHNEGEYLSQTIRAVSESIGELDYEIVVVDDASDDQSIEQAVGRFPHVRIFRYDQRQGTSPAKNRGARGPRRRAAVPRWPLQSRAGQH